MIVILSGPPASGKTTLATGLQERLAARGHEFELLHSDDFARRTYEQMYDRVTDSGADWILDGTRYAREIRGRFRTVGEVYVVHVTASRETALARNRERADPISETGLHVMHATFEPPRADRTVDTDEHSVGEALDRLETAVLRWLDATD